MECGFIPAQPRESLAGGSVRGCGGGRTGGITGQVVPHSSGGWGWGETSDLDSKIKLKAAAQLPQNQMSRSRNNCCVVCMPGLELGSSLAKGKDETEGI